MTGNEYQELAMRTNDGNSLKRFISAMMESEEKFDLAELLNGCLGLSGETGEFLDMIKKWIFHRKPFDEEHAKKELGDVCWYLAEICHAFGWNLDEIMQMNVDKLKARYPEGFSEVRSNNRPENDL